jgi:hypothetical protein
LWREFGSIGRDWMVVEEIREFSAVINKRSELKWVCGFEGWVN